MIPEEIIQKITSDPRMQVPFYADLADFLRLPEENQQYLVELVNDTDDVSAPLFDPACAFIQQRLGFIPADHNREELRTAIDAYRELYQMTYDEKVAMDLSDTEYANFAYQMDTCFLAWLYAQVLETH